MNDRLQDLASGRTGPKAKGFAAWIGGRARRREYWSWIGPIFILQVGATLLSPTLSYVSGIPLILIWIRRLHDLGLSGWLAPAINFGVAILGLIGLALGQQGSLLLQGLLSIIALITLGAVPGQPRTNEFGPPPGRKDDDLAETFT